MTYESNNIPTHLRDLVWLDEHWQYEANINIYTYVQNIYIFVTTKQEL